MKSYDNSTYKMPIRAQNSNKGTFGKVLNLSLDSLMNLDLPEDEQSANDMRQLYLSCPPAARKALLNSARALADELKEMTQADECDQDKKAEEK